MEEPTTYLSRAKITPVSRMIGGAEPAGIKIAAARPKTKRPRQRAYSNRCAAEKVPWQVVEAISRDSNTSLRRFT